MNLQLKKKLTKTKKQKQKKHYGGEGVGIVVEEMMVGVLGLSSMGTTTCAVLVWWYMAAFDDVVDLATSSASSPVYKIK
jgi:hypothetical protein